MTGAVPVAVTRNDPPVPVTTLVVLALTIFGAATTVKVKLCVSAGGEPLSAVTVKVYVPMITDGAIVITPLALFIVTPVGAPDNEKTIGAVPVAVTGNEPPVPVTTVALLSLVMFGTCVTISVNTCDASGDVPLTALTVNG